MEAEATANTDPGNVTGNLDGDLGADSAGKDDTNSVEISLTYLTGQLGQYRCDSSQR